MNDVAELKDFARAHARAQQVAARQYASVLNRVTHDGSGPGSWTHEWSELAEASHRDGRLLQAARLFTMARFPYPDTDARHRAWERCVAAFAGWRDRERVALDPLDLRLSGGRVRCWSTGLDRAGDRPVVIVMGGIVSVKEQWAPVLLRLRRLGIAGVVADMPGVGDNEVCYDDDAWRMISELADELGNRTGTGSVHALAMSFSGHLALRAAAENPRLRAVITVGAPVSAVFADPLWQDTLPRITIDTLAHLTRADPGSVGERIRPWALSPALLGALDIPVAYIASRRDEIIPRSDIELLRRYVRRLRLLENDDVHGSPAHLGTTGPWLTLALLRASGASGAQRAVVSALLIAARLRHRLTGRS